MKVANPDRGWQKFHDDIKKKRKNQHEHHESQQNNYQPTQPTQPIQQTYQPQSNPPTVNYNINPPQTTQGNVNENKPGIGLIIGLLIVVVFVAFLLQPEQTMNVFQTIFERLSNFWYTIKGAM
jgi:hypothetical protein